MLGLLSGMKAYQNQKDFLNEIEALIPKSGNTTFKAEDVLKTLIELGILEQGMRRDKTPTVRIVDLYAFNPELNIKRLGRR